MLACLVTVSVLTVAVVDAIIFKSSAAATLLMVVPALLGWFINKSNTGDPE